MVGAFASRWHAFHPQTKSRLSPNLLIGREPRIIGIGIRELYRDDAKTKAAVSRNLGMVEWLKGKSDHST
jgi:hypothetical protein